MNKQENQKTILLVEDEALIAVIGKQTLNKHDYNAILASSGEKAIEILRTTPDIDLILMDINLGKGMNGIEAAEIILREKDIPILFLSSYTQAEVVEKTERITSYGYVTKDSGEMVLIASIKMAFKLFEAHRELKEREKALRESEDLYRTLTEQSHDGIFIYRENHFLYVNDRMAEIFGYPKEELLSMDFWDLVHPDCRDYVLDIAQRRARGEAAPNTYEAAVTAKDGNVKHLEFAVSAVVYSGSYAAIGSLRDITERKEAEEALRESEERFRSLLQNVPSIAVQGYRLDGITTYWNQASEQFYGYTSQEAIGQNLLDLIIPPEMREDVEESMEQMGRTHLPIPSSELFLIRKDGSRIAVFSHHALVQTLGQPQELFCIDIDLTKRMEAEEKIKSLLAEKELLLREVHHRIKNNMNVIMSLFSLQSSTQKDPSVISSLEDARNRIQTMMVLYDKLYRSADFREISTKEYLTSLVDEIVMHFPNWGSIDIETEIDDFALDAKTLSPMGIILNELLTNAMKHAFPPETFETKDVVRGTWDERNRGADGSGHK
ncbi:MAG: hypothetical protein C0392_16165, partial [Syntrophus sp. (in: bacteria)]|nr:hypothetical protein [Syntrophus sp. (in: bacteria)]